MNELHSQATALGTVCHPYPYPFPVVGDPWGDWTATYVLGGPQSILWLVYSLVDGSVSEIISLILVLFFILENFIHTYNALWQYTPPFPPSSFPLISSNTSLTNFFTTPKSPVLRSPWLVVRLIVSLTQSEITLKGKGKLLKDCLAQVALWECRRGIILVRGMYLVASSQKPGNPELYKSSASKLNTSRYSVILLLSLSIKFKLISCLVLL